MSCVQNTMITYGGGVRLTRSGAFINEFRLNTESNFALLSNALADKHGLGMLNLMLHTTHVPPQYYDIFYKAYYARENTQNLVFIDCGVWAGQVVDLGLHVGAKVYAFEPNKYLAPLLRKKYAENADVIFYQKAVGVGNFHTKFSEFNTLSQGNTITIDSRNDIESNANFYDVEVVDLCEIIEGQILKAHDKIYFLKLDIEGAEFEIMDKLIDKKLYEKIDHIACETHERYYMDGDFKIANLKEKIQKNNIKNIFLDWI
ncbi:FkbM family methyltransferase [Helicobacter saguini]|uniref:FkbM family methyltransferase n=1 Tax=Helicobacter saguini TaxID=1548018 RepID=A0A4U8T8B9_9HELI|nr:FkbM family methyltransferase [Helicobacter saguini]TLD95909.1 FkbM family methyltransferase [Helicobacter saguini]